MIFLKLDLLLDTKEFAAFLRIGKYLEKMIGPHYFDKKEFVYLSRERTAISHFLVTRLRAVRKLYEAT